MINENGDKLIKHHTKYLELHGEDKVVLMTRSDHTKLHHRLRKEGKCNVPSIELEKISKAAAKRERTGKMYIHEQKTECEMRDIDGIKAVKTKGKILRSVVKVRRNGTITVPNAIRKFFELNVGDIIEIDVNRVDG